jgi:antitoxin component HigA of HigAB toxin-antitoxin module
MKITTEQEYAKALAELYLLIDEEESSEQFEQLVGAVMEYEQDMLSSWVEEE